MINKSKITDGDLVFITLEGDVDQQIVSCIRSQMENWLKDKGLSNCKVAIAGGTDIKVNLNILTVNDIFDNEVLKKE